MATPNAASRPPPGSGAVVVGVGGGGPNRPESGQADDRPDLHDRDDVLEARALLQPDAVHGGEDAMASAAASWPPFTAQVEGPSGRREEHVFVEKNGTKKPRYSPKPTASARCRRT